MSKIWGQKDGSKALNIFAFMFLTERRGTLCARAYRAILPLFILALCVLISACKSAGGQTSAAEEGGVNTYGYALLTDLMGDERNVSKLRIIKNEREEIGRLLKEISQVCGDAYKVLENYGRTNPSLNLKSLGLPAAEVQTRKAIAETKRKALLGGSGKVFELELLLSQNEALTYGSHLAGVVAGMEQDPGKVQFLKKLESELSQLRAKLREILLASYSVSPR
jgi:hypothetical protein